jgi:tetratricopeptide (TPR) repeat protein
MDAHQVKWRLIGLLAIMLFAAAPCLALQSGETAPAFSLTDLTGRTLTLENAGNQAMTVLFFFDARSRPSQEGLLMLDRLTSKYPSAGLVVWGITRSERTMVDAFIAQANAGFPVLLDDGEVSQAYNAKLVLPVVCTINSELKIVDFHQGGGKTVESMLVTLAQRQIHRRQTGLATAIGDQLAAMDPGNVDARAVKGYAALKSGDLKAAAHVFNIMAGENGPAEMVGKEGQAAVLARQGRNAEALQAADEVTRKAPQRGYAEMIRGDLLAQQGKSAEALQAYQAALAKPQTAPFQKAEAANRLGQYQARAGKYGEARKLYDQAVALDPYYLEPTSNKGVAFEKEGRWDQALAQYRKTLVLDGSDTIAKALARKAEEMLAVQKDQQRKERVDKLVKELAERFRRQKDAPTKIMDAWTSNPMILSLVDFEEKGALAGREGFSAALTTHLGDLLNSSGRIKVVERALLDRLLTELNLGSSDLADPGTALRLGRVLAAKVLATGSILHLPETTMLSMRLIDSETTSVPKTFTFAIAPHDSLDRRLHDLHRDVLTAIIQAYPLRGYVVQVEEQQVLLNIGTEQGVVQGTRFSVIEAPEPIVYKGRTLQGNTKTLGELEIVSVAPDVSFARIVQAERPLRSDDQVQEILVHAVKP